MPQMSPLWWPSMMVFSVSIILLLMILIHFMFSALKFESNSSSKKLITSPIKSKKWNW